MKVIASLGILAFATFVNSFDSNYFDDNVLFRITTETRDVLDNRIGTDRELIPIVSADDEKYFCMMPEITTKEKSTISDYTGPTPSELLNTIYNEQFCSLRIESYWKYELCHGRYLRQFHDDKEAKISAEYYLGSYPKDRNEAVRLFIQLSYRFFRLPNSICQNHH
jgi:endoplasmic reticulum lectin 1